jgi:hypothetical protein
MLRGACVNGGVAAAVMVSHSRAWRGSGRGFWDRPASAQATEVSCAP